MAQSKEKKGGRGVLSFLRARGKLWLLIGGVLLGVFLLVVGSNAGVSVEQEQGSVSADEEWESAEELEAYCAQLERELEDLCQSVAGVGKVHVMVTLGSGCRIVYTTDESGRVVSVGSGSNQKPLYRTTQPPTVVGVGVVCKGGDTAAVQHTLTELISTTLGISANRVFIAGK